METTVYPALPYVARVIGLRIQIRSNHSLTALGFNHREPHMEIQNEIENLFEPKHNFIEIEKKMRIEKKHVDLDHSL